MPVRTACHLPLDEAIDAGADKNTNKAEYGGRHRSSMTAPATTRARRLLPRREHQPPNPTRHNTAVMVCGCLAAQADAFVYWSESNGSIGRANLDGTGVNESFITGAGGPGALAVDGQHVYWANFDSGTIGRANLDGTGVNQYFLDAAGVATGVAVDGQHIYWGSYTTVHTVLSMIGRANLDGTGVEGIVGGAGQVRGLAVDGQHVYWADYFNTIGRVNLDGTDGNLSFIPDADSSIPRTGGLDGVAVDGQHVYWNGSGTIERANLDGTGVDQSFITTANSPTGVAVDALEPPAASITIPVDGATFMLGQSIAASYGCVDGAGGPGIATCAGAVADGAAIDTATVGVHTFMVTATSKDGQTGSAVSTYTVLAPPAPAPPAPAPLASAPRAPVLGGLTASHSRWRVGSALAQISRHNKRPPVGTTFRFNLNEPATVKLVFTHKAWGRAVKVGGERQCVAPTSHNKHRRRCSRILTASMSLHARDGTDKIFFEGRVSRTRRLSRGAYRVTITATNASGESSKSQSLRFTIVK
jgi:hypothetical protein